MSIQVNEEESGKVVVVHVSGKLARVDYEHFVPEFARLVQRYGKLRVLFDMRGFHGWQMSATSADFKFGIEHFSDIERLAMVGDTRWQKGMATFLQPLTKAAVRYFDKAEAVNARKWLGEA